MGWDGVDGNEWRLGDLRIKARQSKACCRFSKQANEPECFLQMADSLLTIRFHKFLLSFSWLMLSMLRSVRDAGSFTKFGRGWGSTVRSQRYLSCLESSYTYLLRP